MKRQRLAGVVMWGLVVGLVVDMSSAATTRYRESGNWTQTAPTNTGPGWQNVSAVPSTADLGRINWGNNTVTVTTAETIGALQIGVDESGTLVVAGGGLLATVGGGGQNGRLTVGNNNAAAVGTMTVQSGGTVNVGEILFIGAGTKGVVTVTGTATVASHLWMGTQSGVNGTLSISGTMTVSGNIGLGTINANTASGGSATINLDSGGLLNLDRWSAWDAAANGGAGGGSIHAGSLINMLGGTLTIKGNRESEVDAYVTLGRLVGYGGSGTIARSYDSGTNLTTITAIPEPGSFALLGLAGLGLVAVRRRRSVRQRSRFPMSPVAEVVTLPAGCSPLPRSGVA